LKSSLLTKEQYEQIIDKVKTMDEPVDCVLLEKALRHSYVSKEIVDWVIDESKIQTLENDITIISKVISYLQNHRQEMRTNDL